MQISSPVIKQTSSTTSISLTNNPLSLHNLKIIISNSNVNQTITIYDQSGSPYEPFNISTSIELKFTYVNYSKITLNDTNNYNIYYTDQTIIADNLTEYSNLKTKADTSITPLNAPLSASTNTIGAVEVSSLPSIPAGSNTIGNVNIASALPAGSNVIGSVNDNINPNLVNLVYTTSSTANTPTQLTTTSINVDRVTILASSSNTATVLIGNSSSQTYPLTAGASVPLTKTNLSLIYAQSSAASQTLYVIAGGY